MEHYKNLGGDSGVIAFEMHECFIDVQFRDGWIYRYTYQSAGSSNIEEMKVLAQKGEGLNSFIMRRVRKLYSKKFR